MNSDELKRLSQKTREAESAEKQVKSLQSMIRAIQDRMRGNEWRGPATTFQISISAHGSPSRFHDQGVYVYIDAHYVVTVMLPAMKKALAEAKEKFRALPMLEDSAS